jgi:hypothetical protein
MAHATMARYDDAYVYNPDDMKTILLLRFVYSGAIMN